MPAKKSSKKPVKRPEAYSLKEWARLWDLDENEIAIEKAFAEGKIKLSPNQAKEKALAQAAARNFFRKNARLNIRISEHDLLQLKLRAAREGLPYQTLAASIIHKFVQ